MLKQLILWPNGNRMALDENGEGITELQRDGIMVEGLKAAASPQTVFGLGISREKGFGRLQWHAVSSEDFWLWAEAIERVIGGTPER